MVRLGAAVRPGAVAPGGRRGLDGLGGSRIEQASVQPEQLGELALGRADPLRGTTGGLLCRCPPRHDRLGDVLAAEQPVGGRGQHQPLVT